MFWWTKYSVGHEGDEDGAFSLSSQRDEGVLGGLARDMLDRRRVS